MTRKRSRVVEPPWLIHFFRRSDGAIPTRTFLDAAPARIAAEIHAVLEAVATAPPPAFSGGGKWEAMHGDMRGLYEIRVRQGRALFRLICLLDRNADDLGGPSIVCLGGLVKTSGAAADPRDYSDIRGFAAEFRKCRTVMR
jgi:Txe/YoeB family toxin of Txe-Axe toxin-antitoxin module